METDYSVQNSEVSRKAGFRDYFEMTKPRLSLMAVVSALFGYFAASSEKDLQTLTALFIGTSLAAGGAAILNQWLERVEDSMMARTAGRPIPSGIVSPQEALALGIILSVMGTATIYLGTNVLASVLIILTLGLYLLAYTPLKKTTAWSIQLGAIPGAIPPLVGWVAAENSFGLIGWVLFAVLFTWQIPHFMAIAWIYRHDYERAGFSMPASVDKSGKLLAWQAIIFTLLLIAITIIPIFYSHTNKFYLVSTLILNAGMLYYTVRFCLNIKDATARPLFITTLVYLPLYLSALIIGLHL
jgi:heme o synthase